MGPTQRSPFACLTTGSRKPIGQVAEAGLWRKTPNALLLAARAVSGKPTISRETGVERYCVNAHGLRCYHPAMRRIPIPLLLLIIVIAFPVAVPIAIVLHLRDSRRMQVVAERTRCERC